MVYRWSVKYYEVRSDTMKLKALFMTVFALTCAWVLASFADVVTHNLDTCVYQSWNIFAILWGVA